MKQAKKEIKEKEKEKRTHTYTRKQHCKVQHYAVRSHNSMQLLDRYFFLDIQFFFSAIYSYINSPHHADGTIFVVTKYEQRIEKHLDKV